MKDDDGYNNRKVAGTVGTPCAGCKQLRRRCSPNCVFLPHFPAEDPHKFACIHRVFGASNVSKILQELPEDFRADAVSSMVYEANARVRDPVYGCAGAISYLQQQIGVLQSQLAVAQAEISQLRRQQMASSQAATSTSLITNSTSGSPPLVVPFLDMDMVLGHASLEESIWLC